MKNSQSKIHIFKIFNRLVVILLLVAKMFGVVTLPGLG